MNKWKIDVPVLLIFFARPNEFRQVFESVREAKPSTLLLWQDGPRPGRPDDLKNIEECRKIADSVDWECTIYKNYHEQNMGCDPSTFLAQKWAFSLVEKCIIMEDDRIPDQTFYRYCKELLDYYENDTRISHICGTNLLELYDSCDGDYFFAANGSTTWASWRRVAKQWDESYSYLHATYALKCLRKNLSAKDYDLLIQTAKRHAATGKQFWETILGMSCILHHQVAIIPKQNLICDIGHTVDSTHAPAELKYLPEAQRKIFHMKTYQMQFPICHPRYILVDRLYDDAVDKIIGIKHPILKARYAAQRLFNYVRYGDFERICSGIKNRLHKH